MLYENATASSLGLLRAVGFGLWLILFADSYPYAELPPDLFYAKGVFRWLPDPALRVLLGEAGQGVFRAVFLVAVPAAALGLPPYRLWGPLAALCLVIFDGVAVGFAGSIGHARTAWLMALILLSFAPAADACRVAWPGQKPPPRRPGSAYAFPVLLVTAAVLLCYTFIGVFRFRHGGLEAFNGEALRSWLVLRSLQPGDSAFQFGLTVADTPWLFLVYRAGFFVITALEAASLFCLLSRRFAWFWLANMIVFHFLSLFTLNIFFWENIILLILLFAPWREAPAAWFRWRGLARPEQSPGGAP